MRRILSAGLAFAIAGCPAPRPTDGGDLGDAMDLFAVDAVDAPADLQPVPTTNCVYEPVPATARAGGTVTAGDVTAGAAEARLDLPVGTAMGGYSGRADFMGGDSRVDERVVEQSAAFRPSVGVETAQMVRAIAITAGEETVVIVKVDLTLADDGITFAIAERLGPEFAGKVIFLTSHTHGGMSQYSADTRLALGLSVFRRAVFDRVVNTAVTVAQQALAQRVPARVGVSHDAAFDPADTVSHDRRTENDDLPGGAHRKDNDLFVLRVDAMNGDPIAMMAVFGVHGT
ncbi:MAG: neutral/alkaline non-lysosomal ceramidase N-terminal domain-containing protein, partial [Deltaproteobacteria bacterium]